MAALPGCRRTKAAASPGPAAAFVSRVSLVGDTDAGRPVGLQRGALFQLFAVEIEHLDFVFDHALDQNLLGILVDGHALAPVADSTARRSTPISSSTCASSTTRTSSRS